MKDLKSIADLLHSSPKRQEITISEQKRYAYRRKQGYFTRNENTFDFIYLLKAWGEIVGEFMAKNSLPLRTNRKTLYVATKHQIFAAEMSFLIPEILKKIHERFPSFKDEVLAIKFVNNEFKLEDMAQAKQITPKKTKSRPKLHPYSPEYIAKKNNAAELFQDIEDEEVREILLKYYLS